MIERKFPFFARRCRARSTFSTACRGLVSASLLLVLVACAPVAVRAPGANDEAAQSVREAGLSTQPDWSFSGRVALSRGKDGGSGRIAWQQRGENFEIRLSAPITGQSWRLLGEAGRVRLEGLEGGVREGTDAEALLLEATGWRIPVVAMQDWVRGARTSGDAAMTYDAQGLPATLVQQDWAVEYRAWDRAAPPRPLKVFAKQGDASVRLVIEAWSVP